MGRPAMARTLSYFYLAGGTLVLVSLALPYDTRGSRGRSRLPSRPTWRAPRCSVLRERLPSVAVPVALALGTLLVTVLVWCEGDGSSFFGLFYLWVAVEAFYLLSRAGAALQVGLVAVAYGGVLAVLPDDRPAPALADGGRRGHRGGGARGVPARQDRRARGLARRRRPHRPAHRPAQQARLRGAVRERARAGASLERASIRAPRRSGRLQGRERPLRARGRRRRCSARSRRTCSSGSAGWTRRPGSAARSSRCSFPRPTSAARSSWRSACAAPPTAALPRTRSE